MHRDRRLYERININVDANIYINNKEYPVTIKDISECGVLFICEDITIESLITTDSVISFQSMDSYELFDIVHNDIIIGRGKVVRVDDSSRLIGVALKAPNRNLIKYIENKKIVQFLKRIN